MNEFANNETRVLTDLSNELRVLLDLRYRFNQVDTTHNVVDMRIKRMQDTIAGLIKNYQLLIGPSASFLMKYGDEVKFDEYHQLTEFLTNVEKTIESKKQSKQEKPRANHRNPRP